MYVTDGAKVQSFGGLVVRDNTAGTGAGAFVSGTDIKLASSAGAWSNTPVDVELLTNAYVYGTTDFSCDEVACSP